MNRILSFEAMRGIAAIAVAIFHAERIIPHGYLAVDLFFMLSGFVLFRAYRDRLGTFRQFLDFTVRRVIRLYPLMFLGAAIGLAINGGSLWTLALIPSGEFQLYPANIPLWSLMFEMIASLVFAALFRYGKIMWWLIWIISAAAFGIAAYVNGSASVGVRIDDAAMGLFRIGFSFTTGIGIAYICKWEPKPVRWGFIIPLAPMIVFANPYWSGTYDIAAIYSFFPALIVLASRYEVTFPRIAIFLGAVSYPLYAIHHPIVKMVEGAGWLYLPLFAALILAAWLLDRYYDAPIRARLMRLKKWAESPSREGVSATDRA